MKIAVASGKGGTGKTTVSVALAQAFDSPVCLIDSDVEEPNSAFFLKPGLKSRTDVTIPVPNIDAEKCTGCGACSSFCTYNAIAVAGKGVMVFPELCHSCGGCTRICPANAITEIPKVIGELSCGQSGTITTLEGRLKIGCAMAPPLIRAAKKAAPDLPVIIDSPPGTSCPMITAVSGCDFVVLVTEPTPFGLNDLKLAVETVRKLGLPFSVVINRSDAGDDRVVRYCEEETISILLQIPESREIAKAYSRGDSLLQAEPALNAGFRNIIRSIQTEVSQ
ncbi:ATP-binding protein [Tichowtungia aerotolerans]|uniref:P-loop NTPase n=1 Tax=Tichowtungia aerotolerans TaxID=2697043 RepID=A0A6P1MBJ0_9BACT|nr:ATP-binding protein [Tichowtungia aerotolerans]QHI69458.1 P-loop NTPase [Tichowtungia aerotolerans]